MSDKEKEVEGTVDAKAETAAAPAAKEEAPAAKEETTEVVAEEVVEEAAETPAPVRVDVKEEPVKEEPFDWEAAENSNLGFAPTYTSKEQAEFEQLYSETLNVINEKEVVIGSVIAVNENDVVLSIGYKCDGVLPRSEFRDMKDLAIGDEVDVYVESMEDKIGQLVLSRSKARMVKAWETIYAALDNDDVLEGLIKRRTKGGLIMDLLGVEAFLPGSQIDVKPIRDFDVFVGKTMEVKVVKINAAFENVVVSHKMLIEKDIEEQRSAIIKNLDKGQVLEGTIKNMTNFGVFIDLGGLDGLLHITDISWGRISHPEEVLKLDEKVKVVVLDFDDDKNRISLGMKQLHPHPWDAISDTLKEGSQVKGRIVNVADYGAFLEIAPGVEGLIHVSEMSWSQHLRNPSDFLSQGDEVDAVVLTIDKEDRKMSLGIKQLTEDPWTRSDFTTRYEIGSTHSGKVRNLTNFGLFVEMEEGVDGLVHVSDLSWTKKIKHPSEFVKVGDMFEVKVLELDVENRKLALGHKQLEENPWDSLEEVFPVGSDHQCTVIESNEKVAVLELPYGIEGICTIKHSYKEDGSKVDVGETLPFRVLDFNKGEKKIVLSHLKIWDKTEQVAADKKKTKVKSGKMVGKINQSSDKTTLGELDALSALKAKMEGAAQEEVKAEKKAASAPAAKKEVVEEAAAPAEEATPAVAEGDDDPKARKYKNPETNRMVGYKKALELDLIDEEGNAK